MRILYLVHQYLPRHKAGTEIYTHSLAKAMSARHECLVYTHEPALDGGEAPFVEDSFEGVRVRRVAAYTSGGAPRSPIGLFERSYRNPAIGADLRETLERFRPDLVHVQHLKDLSVDVLSSAHRAGVPIAYTLNDFWGVCPNAQLVRPGGGICHGAPLWLACGRCAAYRLGQPALTVAAPAMIPLFARRQRVLRQEMAHVDLFLAPSAFLRDKYVAHGYPADRFRVVEYGLDVARLAGCPSERQGFRKRYAYIGSLAWQKGVHVLIEAFRRLGEPGAELRIWGGDQAFPAYARDLRRAAEGCPGIRFEGELDSNRIGEALAWADYQVIPSVWFENSPVTIREAYHCQVPVIASRLGAMAEKVPDGVSGLLFRAGDADDLARVLRRTLDEPELLPSLRAGIPKVVTMDEHIGEIEGIYKQLLEARRNGDAG